MTGLVAFTLFSVWIHLDWRVRSARSVLLLVLALAAVLAVGFSIDPPVGLLLAVGAGGILVAPVLFKPPVCNASRPTRRSPDSMDCPAGKDRCERQR